MMVPQDCPMASYMSLFLQWHLGILTELHEEALNGNKSVSKRWKDAKESGSRAPKAKI